LQLPEALAWQEHGDEEFTDHVEAESRNGLWRLRCWYWHHAEHHHVRLPKLQDILHLLR
jgi:hypothetical protein